MSGRARRPVARYLRAALLPTIALFSLIRPAAAQLPPLIPGIATQGPEATVPERMSVGQRVEPDYQPIGVRAGSFIVYPSAELQENYDTNVFVTETSKVSDYSTIFRPGLSVMSDWNTNALNLTVGGDIRRYVQEVSENESNVSTAASGRLDIEEDVYLTGGMGYQLAHEDRTSPNTVINQKTPTGYELASGRLGYVHEPGRLGLRINGGIDYYSYDNNETSTGVRIIEDDRNRVELGLAPRVTYEIIPGYHAFFQVPLNKRVYQSTYDALGYRRSSNGYEFDAGTAFEISRVINGEVYVGYLEQDYDDARLSAARGPAFGGNLLWNVTDLTSIRGTLARTVEETTLAPASSYIQSLVGISVEHKLLRNLLLTAGADYTSQDYQGFFRSDHLYDANIGGRYLINEYLSASLSATYRMRVSNTSDNGYHDEILSLGARLQY